MVRVFDFRGFLSRALMLLPSFTQAQVKPNVVFILAIDQGWRDCGFMGHPHIKTPSLDRLEGQRS